MGTELSDSPTPGKRHFTVRLTPTGIGRQLRTDFHGIEVQRIQRGCDEIRDVVRYPAERRRSLREFAVFPTGLTTVVGLSPLLYASGSELLRFVPFVIGMPGGPVAAGIFTLFILPTPVTVVDGSRE